MEPRGRGENTALPTRGFAAAPEEQGLEAPPRAEAHASMAPEAEEASIAESRRGQVGLLGEDVYMMPKGPFPLSPRGRGKGRADWVAAAHRGAALRRSPSTKGVWGPIIQRTVVRGRRLDIYAAMYKRTSARLFFFFFLLFIALNFSRLASRQPWRLPWPWARPGSWVWAHRRAPSAARRCLHAPRACRGPAPPVLLPCGLRLPLWPPRRRSACA